MSNVAENGSQRGAYTSLRYWALCFKIFVSWRLNSIYISFTLRASILLRWVIFQKVLADIDPAASCYLNIKIIPYIEQSANMDPNCWRPFNTAFGYLHCFTYCKGKEKLMETYFSPLDKRTAFMLTDLFRVVVEIFVELWHSAYSAIDDTSDPSLIVIRFCFSFFLCFFLIHSISFECFKKSWMHSIFYCTNIYIYTNVRLIAWYIVMGLRRTNYSNDVIYKL